MDFQVGRSIQFLSAEPEDKRLVQTRVSKEDRTRNGWSFTVDGRKGDGEMDGDEDGRGNGNGNGNDGEGVEDDGEGGWLIR